MRSLDDLTMYVYGLLDPPEEEAMTDHLEQCSACAVRANRIASEQKLFKGALARVYPDLPAWAEARHRRRP